jgi:hypothetical protein
MNSEGARDVRRLRVFLCHAKEDKAAVRDLYKRLTRDGYQPWLDTENLLPGADWREAIADAVRASDVVLVCLSKNSIKKEGFVQREIADAIAIAKEKPEGTIFIVPARLEECSVPNRLEAWQWVDLFEPDGYERLSRSLDARSDHLRIPRPSSDSATPTAAPPVSIEPAVSWLGLVLAKDPPHGAIFNMDCRLTNRNRESVSIHRLEVWITDPYNSSLHMVPNVFYETKGFLQTRTGNAAVLTLAPGETRVTGIQFVAPPSIVSYRWSPGLYSFDLVAWLVPPRGRRPSVITPYEMRVDEAAAEHVARWHAEYDAQRDPDSAISIPVPIFPAAAR